MPESPRHHNRPNHPPFSMLNCSPVAIFGAGLILAQIILVNIGLSFFRSTNGTSSLSSTIPHSFPGNHHLPVKPQAFQQIKRKKLEGTKRVAVDDPKANGTFSGYPMYYQEKEGLQTWSHCVGENYQDGESWMQRSCKFHFFCFDTSTKDFVVFQSRDEERFYDLLEQRPFVDVSQSYVKKSHDKVNTVSLGGINLKWTMRDDGVPRLEWFPEIRTMDPKTVISFYMLSPNVVMVPFHSMNGANPGHLVWDDYLPIYTLLTMFQLEKEADLLMMRYVLKGEARGLWASCDWRDDKQEDCMKMHRKFLPLMVGPDSINDLATTEDFSFKPNGPAKSNLVCAKNGVAGIGPLTDHGTKKLHGWEEEDYKLTHNHGRGGLLYDFRSYMMANVGLPLEFDHRPPFRIVFSEKSSNILSRILDFTLEIDLLRKSFNPRYVSVESYVFKDLTLMEQLEIASQTSIFITGCGGGAVSAFFLPKGASVLLYFLEDGGMKNNRETGTPARLDWDLFNNMGYLKVHWLPRMTMHREADLRSLAFLVNHELDALMRERSYDKFFM